MAGAKETAADVGAARKDADAKSAKMTNADGHVPVDRDEMDEEEDEEQVEKIVIRAEPMPQQGAAPADVERGLRLIARSRERGSDDVEAVRRLVREGAPAGFIATSGWTPVAAAASVGNNNILLYLLELGADGMYATARRSSGDNNGGNGNNGANVGDAPSTPLLSRRTSSVGGFNPSNDVDSAISMPNTATANANINTPLHWSSYGGHADTVVLLLQAGYSLEDRDPEGNQSLHLAASGGHREVLELLLAHAAPADARNRFGNCPEDLATNVECRRLLARFREQRGCQWCKEQFSRIRRPSLCQRCANVYCDTKPCSSTTSVSINVATSEVGALFVPRRTLRFCQECATEMRKAEQELRAVLESKQELIRQALGLLAAADGSGRSSSRQAASHSVTAAAQEATVSDGGNGSSAAAASGGEVADGSATPDNSQQEANTNGDQSKQTNEDTQAESADQQEQQQQPPSSRGNIASDAAVLRALTLTQTDAEALYTALETAWAKAAASLDASLLEDARRTYHQLVAHVALQEEIKGLMLVRPIGTRSLLTPLKLALQVATREQVAPEMLALARRVVRGAEAECTLFGAHALCESQVPVGGKAHARDIARLDASLRAAKTLGASDKLLAQASALLARLHAEVQLEACLVTFKPVTASGAPVVVPQDATATSEEPIRYLFHDGTVVDSLLQALELRAQQVSAAVEAGSAVEGVSPALLEDGANVLKQLKKSIREEAKNEEERRRLEEEATLKAAKKGKKKKKA